ncbi:MAG: hypothetical protein NTU54_07895 [Candidatus Omnitrophica bacterium]|nr:hypothetical protein [Candidatus Omnitrophota bacterium]
MEELSVLEVAMVALRILNLFFSFVGILVGLDLILGARVLTWAGKTLNKSLPFDKTLIKALSNVKNLLDKEISLDKALFNTKIRFVTGILIILLAGILYSLAK